MSAEDQIANLTLAVEALTRRVDALEGKNSKSTPRGPRRGWGSDYNPDGSMRCPFGDLPGGKACSDHSYSGCGCAAPP